MHRKQDINKTFTDSFDIFSDDAFLRVCVVVQRLISLVSIWQDDRRYRGRITGNSAKMQVNFK